MRTKVFGIIGKYSAKNSLWIIEICFLIILHIYDPVSGSITDIFCFRQLLAAELSIIRLGAVKAGMSSK